MRQFVFVIATVCLALWFASVHEASAPRPRPELQFGTPSGDFVVRHGFVQAPATHYTPWTLEHLTAASFRQNALRSDFDFYSDDEQPAECRWTNRDYEKSGYDKGHMHPASNAVSSVMAMRDSFVLTNTMPQTPELNRGPWRMLEEHVCQLVEAGGGAEAWVATGPAWLPDEEGKIAFEVLGSHAIWIPTHCWKAVLVKYPSGHFEAFAWMLPNNGKPPKFEDCRVSIDDVEAATGFDFFAGLPDEIEDKLEAAR